MESSRAGPVRNWGEMIIKFLFWFVLGAAAWALFAGLGIEVYELTKDLR